MKVTSYTYKHTLCLNGLINCLIEIQMIVDRECLGALSAATCWSHSLWTSVLCWMCRRKCLDVRYVTAITGRCGWPRHHVALITCVTDWLSARWRLGRVMARRINSCCSWNWGSFNGAVYSAFFWRRRQRDATHPLVWWPHLIHRCCCTAHVRLGSGTVALAAVSRRPPHDSPAGVTSSRTSGWILLARHHIRQRRNYVRRSVDFQRATVR